MGVVLDLIKAFNVVCRPFLEALMIRLGFPVIVVQAWFASMKGLTRQPLVAGSVFGSSSSTTGIPEGDPLSILGMFSLCCLFREVVRTTEPLAVPFSYADNWEVVAGDVQALIGILEALDKMTTVCLLPVAPSKCWTWAFAKTDRKVLGSCSLAGQRVLVKETGWRIWHILTDWLLQRAMVEYPVAINGYLGCVVCPLQGFVNVG